MTFDVFQKSVDALHKWRQVVGQENYHFPDSRDPSFQKYLASEGANAQDYEKAIVCLCCWRENREDLYTGMMAIAQVINNRARKGWHHGNAYQNVIEKNQFSSMSVPDDKQLNLYPEDKDVEFGKLLTNIDSLYENELIDRTDGSLYYANLMYIDHGGWFERNISHNPEHPRLATIGRTTFFQ